jgi:protein-S-isoprenylcysteine O-methyltransferase Ste14
LNGYGGKRESTEQEGGESSVTTNPYFWLHLAEIAWIVFLLYWFFSALKLKTVKQREPNRERVVYLVFMVMAYFLMFDDRLSFRWLGQRFVPAAVPIEATGVAITAVGVAFAIWARWHLGQNWSATVTLKEGHQLIRSGPYGRVRHPIYTGMLFGLAGTALALGEYRGLIALGTAVVCFTAKARKEERYLVGEFGEKFRDHIRQTGMFLPKWIAG